MNHLSIFVIAVLLVVASAGLIVWHIRTWNQFAAEEPGERELKFRRRQYRRRLQTSTMIGLLGVAIFVGQLLLDTVHSQKFHVYYWIGVLLLVLWILLLAIGDMVATSFYYSRERSDFAVQHAKLQAELRKARDESARAEEFRRA